ncbi:Multiple RNA-binding domain-containing protein 1 [Madurella mycetomatis]|uniref:Multiple RNA-binding domain-containing protein 1 n=1 Tax=Madurella mycetomatis TaxID=100816 RepID=A0A175W9Z2_9PEZI|nr:Multiple RNA-binding domain-containing protein 1 [Madurella mycetomatis]
MESSRVFVKNLPPAISEAEFRKHFSAEGREVTDVKLIPHRRIGFVGYRSHEDAAKAVKYFNRSFIRMSKVAVDLAKPIADSASRPAAKNNADRNPIRPSFPKASVPDIDPTEDANPKKRKRQAPDEADPKLQEYLEVMGHTTKKPRGKEAVGGIIQSDMTSAVPPAVLEAGESDDEYEDIPARPLKTPVRTDPTHAGTLAAPLEDGEPAMPAPPGEPAREAPRVPADATDDDWLRSRTSRLLDLVDPDDPEFSARSAPPVPDAVPASEMQEQSDDGPAANADEPNEATSKGESHEDDVALVLKTSRLFLRNLSYTVTEDDIREHFGKFGNLEEVNLPLDNRGKSKGFAMIRYEEPAAAVAAFQTDGSTFQGRIIHILPAAARRENKLDEFAISKLPLKKQQLLKKKAEAASSTFNWNSLFMSQDAVNAAVAERLGVSKHELLDPTDASAAVKQAVAETTVIQEAKSYFASHGVNIEAFKSQQRGDTSILVKNIRNTSIEELRSLFEEHGTVLRVLMPPSGTIAIVQFAQPANCRAAFAKKAYSRFKDSVLFLEKGPKGLFVDHVAPPEERPVAHQKPSVAELLERDDGEDQLESASLFVRNLNFSTTTESLTNAFKPLDGFVSAKVKTKTDPKRPGQLLSMGFGFCAFKTREQAQAALKVMDGYVLDGYKLIVKASHRGHDAAEERRREDLAKKAAAQRTKIVIKNLPFEASKSDVRALFSTYGRLVALRLPKKFNHSSRGFAFAEFSTAKEALNALTALKDTHLLGRRLVLDFAEADEVDPEEQIKAMEKKIRGQVNKVTLQQLTGGGRTKVNIGGDEDDEP